jgi:hypothetical protein
MFNQLSQGLRNGRKVPPNCLWSPTASTALTALAAVLVTAASTMGIASALLGDLVGGWLVRGMGITGYHGVIPTIQRRLRRFRDRCSSGRRSSGGICGGIRPHQDYSSSNGSRGVQHQHQTQEHDSSSSSSRRGAQQQQQTQGHGHSSSRGSPGACHQDHSSSSRGRARLGGLHQQICSSAVAVPRCTLSVQLCLPQTLPA